MEFIFIIIGIVVFISSIAKKAKQEEARRAAAERAAAQRRAEMGQASPIGQTGMAQNRQAPLSGTQIPGYPARPAGPAYAPMQPRTVPAPAADPRFPHEFEGTASRGSMEDTRTEGRALRGRAEGPQSESRYKGQTVLGTTLSSAYKGGLRVVKATSEGGHSHQETSMTGDRKCPPPEADQTKLPIAVNVGGFHLEFESTSVKQGILYSEILGKPKALRR